MAKTITNHYQRPLIEQRKQPIRSSDTHKIQEAIRNESYNQEYRSEDTKQEARRIPYYLQDDVKNELDRLIKSGHLERFETIEEDCFVSPVVITVKKDKTVKIALDARKLNESCTKKRPHMPNMDELINQISSELSKNESDPIWISVIDLDYAYGQMRLAPETSKHCNFAITGEKINGYYRFLKGFYGPADIPTIFQKNRPNTRPPNTRVVGRHNYRNTRYKRTTHTKTGISLNETRKRRIQSQQKEIKILPKRNNMVGTYHITRRNQTEQRKNELESPTNTKTLKSFLGAIE